MWERIFKLQENETTLRRELSGGATTFMTMAHIIFVQSTVMHAAGMDFEAAMVASPPSIGTTFLQLDISGVLQLGILPIIFVFLFLDLFDTVGTLIGVSQEGGFFREDGTVPRARQALFADAAGTCAGALLGSSTVISYIESAAGIAAGARTGLANLATGTLFLPRYVFLF